MSNRDWRSSAYLRIENWPECIPWMGPKRRYGPYPWNHAYFEIEEVDTFPSSHPDAASVGDTYLGDVCPFCGVPLSRNERVVMQDGTSGTFHEVDGLDEPEPAYHPECWTERRGIECRTLSEFV